MKPVKTPLVLFLFVFTSILLGITPKSESSQSCKAWVAKVVSIQGMVTAQKAGQNEIMRVKLDQTFSAGDRIMVGENSRAAVQLCNEAITN